MAHSDRRLAKNQKLYYRHSAVSSCRMQKMSTKECDSEQMIEWTYLLTVATNNK